MVAFRAALLSSVCLATIFSASRTCASADEQHGKSAKQCNDELKANAAAIEAAGESASAFFHACWWHTGAGAKTPVEAPSKPTAASEKAAKTAALETAASGRSQTSRPVARPTHVMLRRRVRSVARSRHAPPSDDTTIGETAASGPSAAVDDATRVGSPVPVVARQAPAIETIPVTVAGVPRAVLLPVLAGYSPMVRELLNHPAVPGLTAAP